MVLKSREFLERGGEVPVCEGGVQTPAGGKRAGVSKFKETCWTPGDLQNGCPGNLGLQKGGLGGRVQPTPGRGKIRVWVSRDSGPGGENSDAWSRVSGHQGSMEGGGVQKMRGGRPPHGGSRSIRGTKREEDSLKKVSPLLRRVRRFEGPRDQKKKRSSFWGFF